MSKEHPFKHKASMMINGIDVDYEDYRETRRCDSSCGHFDVINQCCWVMTEKTGLFTEVKEGDYCIHGFKEDY